MKHIAEQLTFSFERPLVDLSTCQPGQKLLSSHGQILIYVGRLPPGSPYDHKVKYANGGSGTRTNDGYVCRYPNNRMKIDHDIVEILPLLPT